MINDNPKPNKVDMCGIQKKGIGGDFKVKLEHQNKGIMTRHLPIYLDRIKGFGKVLAVVMEDNLISIKLLLANGFKELGKINNKRIFICEL